MEQLAQWQTQFEKAVLWSKPQDPMAANFVVDRFFVYKRAFQARMEESFEEDFPRVLEILGKKSFSRFVLEYLRTEARRYASLSERGRLFPNFIEQKKVKPTFLGDLARWEWLQIEIQLSSSEAFLHPQKIIDTLKADGPQGARLILNPSIRIPRLTWNVAYENESPRRLKKSSALLCWARGGQFHWEEVSQSQLRLIEIIRQSPSLHEMERSLGTDFPPKKLSQQISQWVADQIIFDIQTIKGENE